MTPAIRRRTPVRVRLAAGAGPGGFPARPPARRGRDATRIGGGGRIRGRRARPRRRPAQLRRAASGSPSLLVGARPNGAAGRPAEAPLCGGRGAAYNENASSSRRASVRSARALSLGLRLRPRGRGWWTSGGPTASRRTQSRASEDPSPAGRASAERAIPHRRSETARAGPLFGAAVHDTGRNRTQPDETGRSRTQRDGTGDERKGEGSRASRSEARRGSGSAAWAAGQAGEEARPMGAERDAQRDGWPAGPHARSPGGGPGGQDGRTSARPAVRPPKGRRPLLSLPQRPARAGCRCPSSTGGSASGSWRGRAPGGPDLRPATGVGGLARRRGGGPRPGAPRGRRHHRRHSRHSGQRGRAG